MSVIKFALHRQNVLTKAMNCLFKYNGNRVQYARALSDGVFISKSFVLEHVRKRRMARFAKFKLLYLQMTMLRVVSSYARYVLSMQTTGLCYTTVE